MAWLNHEEKLFRRHEHHFLSKRLNSGFIVDGNADVEGFLKLAKSVGQRRFSRMGQSLEHHLAAVFTACRLRFTHGGITERTSKPDFVFPSIAEYRDRNFPTEKLSILASKSSLKDRWRQVINEADRVDVKHVFTLEQGISIAQTTEMTHQKIQLVSPRALHATFREEQRRSIWDLARFVEHVKILDA